MNIVRRMAVIHGAQADARAGESSVDDRATSVLGVRPKLDPLGNPEHGAYVRALADAAVAEELRERLDGPRRADPPEPVRGLYGDLFEPLEERALAAEIAALRELPRRVEALVRRAGEEATPEVFDVMRWSAHGSSSITSA